MKICFVNPAPVSYIIERGHETSGAYPPLGILSIVAYLKSKGYNRNILIDQHATKIPTNQVLKKIKQFDPSIIGFNSITDINMGVQAVKIARRVKKFNPNVKIVFGNYHATFNHDRLLEKYPFIDICVRGEAELTFHELVEMIEREGDLRDVRGITYRDSKGNIKINQQRPLIEDLDTLPFPDRSLIQNIEYSQNYGGLNADYGMFTTIQSSRGCTFNCGFCSQSKLTNQQWRAKSVDRVIEELQYLKELGYSNLYWVDDNFTNKPKRTIELCRAIRKNNLDFIWISEQRVDLVSRDLIENMQKAGCRTISLGIESATQRIIDYFNKQITPKMALDAAKIITKSDIDFLIGTFVIGAPTETLTEIKKTFAFARQLEIDFPQFHIFGAIPGTEVWDDLVESGKIDPDKYWETGVKTLVPSLEVVENEMKQAYIDFMNRPKFLLKQIFKTIKSIHRLKILISNIGFLMDIKNVERFFDFTINTWTHGI
ncbi:MAG: radical SAM protein [Candidatus Lokiarchaeota archaeon]|nr:radical SAM protein [Candidatus Lokiarchaeota archaeon]MBD3199446.1 radical SAM protein [Candidatus Lokiarchaeota archaeon]